MQSFENFNQLLFADCIYGFPEIVNQMPAIKVANLKFKPSHPLFSNFQIGVARRFVFSGAILSSRKLTHSHVNQTPMRVSIC
jgi:hypothetical protein